MPAVETAAAPPEEAASDQAALLKSEAAQSAEATQSAESTNGQTTNGDSGDELKRLREENEKLQTKVNEQEKEIDGLKADVQKYKDESEGKRKRTSSTSKSKGLFGRKKKPAEEQPHGDATSPEGDTAPSGEEAAAASGEESAPVATVTTDEAATNETDAATAGAEAENSDKTPKKKSGGIKDRLGRAFGRFRHPKGYEETPKDEPEAAEAAAGGKTDALVLPEHKQVTWTVAKSFERPPAAAEAAADESTASSDKVESEEGSVLEFKDWTNEAVKEWLTDLQLERYADTCQLNGQQMLKTSDAQFDKELGVHNAFHRKKLRLTLNAIASGADLPKELFDWDVNAVAELLQYHGLPRHIIELFVENRIDGRLLTFLTMDDMTAMKIGTPYLQACIKRPIQLLRQEQYGKGYRKTYLAPEPLPEVEEQEEAPAAEAGDKPAEATKPAKETETQEEAAEKPTEEAEGETKEKTEDEKKADEEKAAAEKKAQEEKEAEEAAKKKEEEQKKKEEAAKQRQQRYNELCLSALKEQKEVVTWSNSDVIVWLTSAPGLAEQAAGLTNSGLSGALMVLDPCCTSDTLCASLAVPSKDIATKETISKMFSELMGEEVMSQKSEASKIEHYCVLSPTTKAKRKRSLSFSGALRRKQRGEKPAPPSIYLCAMDEVSQTFVEAHTKDCSIPPPAPEEPAAAAKEEEEKKEGEEKKESAEAESPKSEGETAPLVEKDRAEEEVKKEEEDTPEESKKEEAEEAKKDEPEDAKQEEEQPKVEAEPEAKKEEEEEATEKSKLIGDTEGDD